MPGCAPEVHTSSRHWRSIAQSARAVTSARPSYSWRHRRNSRVAGSKRALGDDLGVAADLHRLDPLAVAGDLRVQQRRPVQLPALADLDLLPESDLAMAGQVNCERPGCRAGGWILGHAPGGEEHAGLPRVPATGEAAHGDAEIGEARHVGTQLADSALAWQPDEDVDRAVAVGLDRQRRRFG